MDETSRKALLPRLYSFLAKEIRNRNLGGERKREDKERERASELREGKIRGNDLQGKV